MRAKVIYLETERTGKIITTNVVDGKITIDDKTFYVDLINPIYVKDIFGYSPIYILKHDTPFPGEIKIEKNIEIENNKTVERYLSSITFVKDKYFDPKLLNRIVQISILANMLKVKKKISAILPLILGVIVGALTTFLIYYFKTGGKI